MCVCLSLPASIHLCMRHAGKRYSVFLQKTHSKCTCVLVLMHIFVYSHNIMVSNFCVSCELLTHCSYCRAIISLLVWGYI